MTAPEPVDPLLGRPLTPPERAALNALWHELEASKRDREARQTDDDGRTPAEARAVRVRYSEWQGSRAGELLAGSREAADPIPLTPEERIAWCALRVLRRGGYPWQGSSA